MTPPTPARVFGFVAAEADVCVLLRRGPSKKVLMVRWNLATDEFEIGQWLHARIVEDRCDLSPDGRLFAYASNDYRGFRRAYPSFTAVSRPPYFTALALWNDDGGGYWPSPTELGIVWGPEKPKVGGVPPGLTVRTTGDRTGAHDLRHARRAEREAAAGKPLYWIGRQEYRPDGSPILADWLDVDHRGRLLLARAGRIYVRDAEGERELIDLNPLEFRPLAPPAWATEWPA